MPLTEKQKAARRERYKNATESQKSNYAKYQRENFKNVSASFKRAEAVYIFEIFATHGVTPAQVIRGAAAALLDGEEIRTESAPLAIPPKEEREADPAPAPATPAEESSAPETGEAEEAEE